VIGSYFVADYVRIRKPRREREAAARAAAEPV
jgi:hypothetical protein